MNYVHGEKIVELLEQLNDKADKSLRLMSNGFCQCEEVIPGVDGLCAQEWKERALAAIKDRDMAYLDREISDTMVTSEILRGNAFESALDEATQRAEKSEAFISSTSSEWKLLAINNAKACDEETKRADMAESALEEQIPYINGLIEGADYLRNKCVSLETELYAVKSNRDLLIKKCYMLQGMYDSSREKRIQAKENMKIIIDNLDNAISLV